MGQTGLQFISMASKCISLVSTHRWMHTFSKLTFQFSHFALELFGCVTCTVVASTFLLCYCAHLYCVTKFDFTDTKFRVILPLLQKTVLISHQRICFLKKYFLVYIVIRRTDESGVPATFFFTLTDYNSPAYSIVFLLKIQKQHNHIAAFTLLHF